MSSVILLWVSNILIIFFKIDLLVPVPFELSDYLFSSVENMELRALEWAASLYTWWIVLALCVVDIAERAF